MYEEKKVGIQGIKKRAESFRVSLSLFINRKYNWSYERTMKFEKVIEIAEKLKINPDELLQLFFGIGIMVMNRTFKHLDGELKAKLRELFPASFRKMSEDDYRELLNILKGFIK